MNCLKCKSDKVIYSWPWTDGTKMMPYCGECMPDFETYYNTMFVVINSTLVGFGKEKMTPELFQEAFPSQLKLTCICSQTGSKLCSSPNCESRGKRGTTTKVSV